MEQSWTVGTEIKKRRRALNMTQEQVAEKLAVNKSQVGHWESGHTAVKYNRLEALATVLGCTPADLVSASVENSPLSIAPAPTSTLDNRTFLIQAANFVGACSRHQRVILRSLLDNADSLDDSEITDTGTL